MPGPKMGPRPPDFDEELVRRSPTFRKWEGLLPGAKLRYACREFVKGQGDDEERLMRRIMIARRNNVRDHKALKWARQMQSSVIAKTAVGSQAGASLSPSNGKNDSSSCSRASPNLSAALGDTKELLVGIGDRIGEEPDKADDKFIHRNSNTSSSRIETEAIISRTSHLLKQEMEPQSGRRTRRPNTLISDDAIREEMDVSAVEATRSYKTWLSLPNGAEFLYNQKYIKGHEAHDWLLRKNIWRRMRYRRENKKMVEAMLCRERGGLMPSAIEQHQQMSRKRKLNDASSITERNGIIDASSSQRVSILDTKKEEFVPTASVIVDHALLSTSTEVVVAPEVHDSNSDTIKISICEQHRQPDNARTLHDHQHHHDPTESATAFAASIALAAGSVVNVSGIGIVADGDHQVTDPAAVEAAVAAALAATDAKTNSYHHHPSGSLVNVDHVVHGTNISSERPVGIHDVTLPTSKAEATTPTQQSLEQRSSTAGTTSTPEAVDLGLALDAAAKLAAAAAVATTSTSQEVVLAAATALTAPDRRIPASGRSSDDQHYKNKDDREDPQPVSTSK